MKKIFSIVIIASFFLSSCSEIMPTIPPIGNPEILSKRKVLIEEFTGVGCVNCPQGSKEIETLLARYPSNLVAISIHAGFFSKPYNSSKFDFRTDDADDLVDTYFGGEPFAYPSATINRQKTNNGTYYIDLREWPGLIASELEEETQVLLDVIHDYSEETRRLDLEVAIMPEVVIPSDLRITVMITENGVVDYQLLPDPDGWTSDYVHKHMLREIVTSFDGEIVSNENLTPGAPVSHSFSYVLKNEWVPENCNAIVIVHRNTSDSREVLNVEEVHVID